MHSTYKDCFKKVSGTFNVDAAKHFLLTFRVPDTFLKHLLRRTCSSHLGRGAMAVMALVIAIAPSTLLSEDLLKWRELSALPDKEGFAGPFAGTHRDLLIVAGGANFPDLMPWEGGTKVWYDRVFMLDSFDGTWKEVGKLPRPLGYGVSISTEEGIVCIGGSDANQHYRECFRLQIQAGKVNTVSLPSLPQPCAHLCGALLEKTIYVAGGLESPTATSTLKTFWSLDLTNPNATWQMEEPWPGPARMLATAAVHDKSFFLCSGTDLMAGTDGKPVRKYLRDAYRFQPGQGWKKIVELPRPAVASPTPAFLLGKSSFLIISGDDGTLVDFKPPEKHPGFPKSILAYDTMADTWRNIGDVPIGQVTTTMVDWRDCLIIPSGEVRPGKRTASVWSLPKSK
jgi:N-acetylneuraminate epimerase